MFVPFGSCSKCFLFCSRFCNFFFDLPVLLGNLSTILCITSGSFRMQDTCTLLIKHCKCSGTGRRDYRWTKPFVNRADHRIWVSANGYQ